MARYNERKGKFSKLYGESRTDFRCYEETKKRKCLRCGNEFLSNGVHNRLCKSCKEHIRYVMGE